MQSAAPTAGGGARRRSTLPTHLGMGGHELTFGDDESDGGVHALDDADKSDFDENLRELKTINERKVLDTFACHLTAAALTRLCHSAAACCLLRAAV